MIYFRKIFLKRPESDRILIKDIKGVVRKMRERNEKNYKHRKKGEKKFRFTVKFNRSSDSKQTKMKRAQTTISTEEVSQMLQRSLIANTILVAAVTTMQS